MATPQPPSGALETPVAAPPSVAGASRWVARFKGPIVAIAGVGAVLSGMVGWYTTYKTIAGSAPASPAVVAPAPAASALSIMVLPFTNLTGDAAQAYVADGLTDSITSDLSRIEGALVVPPATARAYRDKPVPLPQLAHDLGVRYVLQGNVQRSGTKLRVNATLADASTNAQLWTQSFDGDTTDLFALQDQITARMGNSVGAQMVIAAARDSETRKNSPKVADLMLRVRALASKPQSRENWQAVEALYRQVLAMEPKHVQAMLGLSRALSLHASNFPDVRQPQSVEALWEEARALALQVKVMDPGNPRAPFALQQYAKDHADWATALSLAEQAVAAEHRRPNNHSNLGSMYLIYGQFDKALAEFEQSNALSAVRDNDLYLLNAGISHFTLGHDAQAIAMINRAVDLNPALAKNLVIVAVAQARLGNMDKAAQAKAAALKAEPALTLANYTGNTKGAPEALMQWYETQMRPAWRKAGLPE